MRGRVLPTLPIKEDFEGTELNEMTGPGLGQEPAPAEPGKPAPAPGPTNWNVVEPPTAFAYPPLPWNGARFRFEIRKAPGDGKNALCKTIDNKLFQRGQVFIGHPDIKNYTVEADVMTEGNKRKMSEIGLINQRYLIILHGNAQEIEISRNHELIKEAEALHHDAQRMVPPEDPRRRGQGRQRRGAGEGVEEGRARARGLEHRSQARPRAHERLPRHFLPLAAGAARVDR